MKNGKKTIVVISAHAADFVWRAGGAIALHAEKGYEVTVVCLSFGERGESGALWKQENMTLSKVKETRFKEATNAANALGVHDLQFWDLGDYPMEITRDHLFRLVELFRKVRPLCILSHADKDPYNFDHPMATDLAQRARLVAQAHGHNPGETLLATPQLFLFEPQQTEHCDWVPSSLLDISSVWSKKRTAIECMTGQQELWEYYTRVALQRGVHASRNATRKIMYAEAYQSVFPDVVDSLA